MSPLPAPIDIDQRRTAVRETGRNLVVTAGAGTGKTSTLVGRLLRLALDARSPLSKSKRPILDLLAVTFTEKAAQELRLRVAEALLSISEGRGRENPRVRAAVELADLADTDAIRIRAAQALADMERAQIGTIHSFCLELLRLHARHAGLPERLRVDTGEVWEERFRAAFGRWARAQLAEGSADTAAWRKILDAGELGLDELADLSLLLARHPMPAPQRGADRAILKMLRGQWAEPARRMRSLADGARKSNRICDDLRLAADLLELLLEQGPSALPELRLRAEALPASPRDPGQAFSEEEGREAKALLRDTMVFLKLCQRAEPETVLRARELVAPLAKELRASLLAEGWIPFDDLLLLTRDLLQKSRVVRERVKTKLKAILVDEFQDTDPLQYEIILYLCEKPGRFEKDLANLDLDPGKLFIVGDPKQSIYSFRKADLAAYERVVAQVTGDTPPLSLTQNFRSTAPILETVNRLFGAGGGLLSPQPGLQPAYEPLSPSRMGNDSPPVRMVVLKGNEPLAAEPARAREGRWIASWIRENCSGPSPAHPYRDVVILMRTLTGVEPYLAALREANVPFRVNGERNFFQRTEVLDLGNLLSAAVHPDDGVALAGALRSGWGACPDGLIAELSRLKLLDWRAEPPAGGRFDAVRRRYERLRALHAAARSEPLSRLIERALRDAGLEAACAAMFQGEQKVANLRKTLRLARSMEEAGEISVPAFLSRLRAKQREGDMEGEDPLADEAADAVRILSIHRAKGLEFPVVILANLGAGTSNATQDPPRAFSDWTLGAAGISTGTHYDFAGAVLKHQEKIRQEREAIRVLYVGMTRPRDRLILLASATRRDDPAAYLSLLSDAILKVCGKDPCQEPGDFPIGSAVLRVDHVDPATLAAPAPVVEVRAAPGRVPPDWDAFEARWAERRARRDEALRREPFTTPTDEQKAAALPAAGEDEQRIPLETPRPGWNAAAELSRLVGTLCHLALSRWDFGKKKGQTKGLVGWAAGVLSARSSEPIPKEVQTEALKILEAFSGSAAAEELAGADIVGREIPILTPLADGRILEGSIDLLYRKGKQMVVADYKTDRIKPGEEDALAKRYETQLALYTQAVEQALGEKPEMRLIFLRNH